MNPAIPVIKTFFFMRPYIFHCLESGAKATIGVVFSKYNFYERSETARAHIYSYRLQKGTSQEKKAPFFGTYCGNFVRPFLCLICAFIF